MWSFPLCSLKNKTVGQRDRLLEAHWTGCISFRWRKFSSANIIFSSQSKLRRSSVRKTCRKQHNEIAVNWILGLLSLKFCIHVIWTRSVQTAAKQLCTCPRHRKCWHWTSPPVWSGELNVIIGLVPAIYTMLLQIRPCHGSGRYLSAFHLRGLCSIPV
jgi:hypothetical protein